MNVIAYCRVSTDGQVGEDKFGIESQKEQIIRFCQINDYTIVEWFIDEGISGVKEARPQLDRILYGDIENPPYEAVVVAKTDRVARDIELYYYYKMILNKKNIKLLSVSEDFGKFGAFGPILESFTLFVAQMERENITKRTSAGRAVKASQGGYAGGRAPLGYEVANGRLIIKQDEIEVVLKIFELKEMGLSIRQIIQNLNDLGLTTSKGKTFAPASIKVILDNKKFYQGYYSYGNDEWVKGQHQAVLAEE